MKANPRSTWRPQSTGDAEATTECLWRNTARVDRNPPERVGCVYHRQQSQRRMTISWSLRNAEDSIMSPRQRSGTVCSFLLGFDLALIQALLDVPLSFPWR